MVKKKKTPADGTLGNFQRASAVASAANATTCLVAEKCPVCITKGLLKTTVLWLALHDILNCTFPSPTRTSELFSEENSTV